ncbi:TonB-dependent receptor plug domain-containing protein [Terrimonas sp. NA20]|uniref:TonB-dependent receptor plug domain-containing protein n=1 Tax=Terrimonas ginsenosidimutans TaxID=2908004 RepID=A0ABS9KRX5_9BACT|nr:TonB-dependent receptor plug domain-containing protein [Terrimonas ginsenosidimutans]MCG2615071.1 TonB-dependent receptor plug domain-containing protein [Terrimonas ginsenosidimutans]
MSFSVIRRVLLAQALLFAVAQLAAQQVDPATVSKTDTGKVKSLPGITVSAVTHKEVIPAQKLSGQELESLNSFSVADAMRYFAGVQVKDYGGIGGLKTVDMRSMGTNHMGVFYDGIQIGNAQNGQIDLGRFSMDNIESISLYNGQKSDIFQPARDFGSSGTIYLRSRRPVFDSAASMHFKGVVKAGSFDLINPSLLWEKKLNEKLHFSLSSEYLHSSGRYKFRYKRVFEGSGNTAWDTTAVRENGDIEAQRVEAGLFGNVKRGLWNVKAYFYNSGRGIPGAIVNNVWKRAQRQWDRNFFIQGSFQKNIAPKYDLQVNAKYANDYMRYLNPDTTLLYIDNNFHQQEWYVSAANKYALARNFDINLSTDLQYNTLTSNLDGFVFPKRFTSLVALATAGEIGRVKLQASLLATFVSESVTRGNNGGGNISVSAPSKQEFTPAFFLSYKPFRQKEFNIRAFYKKIFRMPTFNDLYYTDIGNIALRPEFTHQYNLGFQYTRSPLHSFLKRWQLQADVYYNRVTDKIIAVPKGSGMYRWMMMNIGLVEIRGIDAVSDQSFQLSRDAVIHLRATYTYQMAQDFTTRRNPDLQAETWGGQIPYIPWHSASLIAGMQYKSWKLNYSYIYTGERYHNSANIPENYEQPWYTSDVSAVKNFILKRTACKISAEINNLFSQDCEVVLNYPMPKRNYKLILSVEL